MPRPSVPRFPQVVLSSLLALVVLMAASAGELRAQRRAPTSADPALDRVDSLVAAGDVAGARASLDRWFAAAPASGPADARARALFLRAELTPRFAAAEKDLLAVVLGYPTSPQAPDALLRLGQGLAAAGDRERAAGYLRRLVADYPSSPRRAAGYVWLARSLQGKEACAAARDGLAAATADVEAERLLRAEREAACGSGARAGSAATTAASVPAPARAAGRYAVQLGAFRDGEHAEALAARARRLGYEPRIVTVGNGSLLRVRVGRWSTQGPAGAAVRSLHDAGLEAALVDDVSAEHPAR